MTIAKAAMQVTVRRSLATVSLLVLAIATPGLAQEVGLPRTVQIQATIRY